MDRTAEHLDIPPFPKVAGRLVQMLGQDEQQIGPVAELMCTDPGLSAALLQRANSAEFGLAQRVDSLQQAIILLGMRRVRQLALTVATASYARACAKNEELGRCWRHTLATALMAEELAKAAKMPEETAYVAGLMHDIGRLGLLVAFPERYASLLRCAAAEALDVLECERYEFSLDHCAAGRMLAERWRLPVEFAIIAGRHHDTFEGDELDLMRLVHVACRMADTLGFGVVRDARACGYEEIVAELPPGARDLLSSREEEMRELIGSRLEALDSPSAAEPAASPPEPDPVEPEAEPDEEEEAAAPGGSRAQAVMMATVIALGVLMLVVWLRQ